MAVKETTQFVKFVEQYSIYKETNCQGKLKVNSIELAGIEGAASLSFGCTNFGSCNVKFEISSQRENGVAGLSSILQVATICSETSYAIYKESFITSLECIQSPTVFFGTLKEMYEHVKDNLDKVYLEARREMQDMD
uniref:Uncharacterized protein n=1 Tax=Amphimedon queenslandica TaxID=400682 RepID=A0A1X7TEF5_AMPQE